MSQIDPTHVAPKTLLIFFAFLVFTAVFGSLLCGLWMNLLPMHALLTEGRETGALLADKYVDADGQFWFSYFFWTASNDLYRSSVPVTEAAYDVYELGALLPMRHSASNPKLNILALLSDDLEADYWSMMRLSGLVMMISLLLAFGWMRSIPLSRLRSLWQRQR